MIQTRSAVAAAAVLALCWLAALVPGVPAAAEDGVYEVRGVAVDVTADTAAAARAQALARGEQEAFRRLLQRLTMSQDHPSLPALTRAEVEPYLQDFSVAEEKSSSVRYLASLDYRFKRDRVRQLLIDHGLLFAETPSKPLLVLPVLESTGGDTTAEAGRDPTRPMLLWDDPNPWRQAWGLLPRDPGLVPLMLPDGDLDDIAAISAEQAVDGDVARLAAIGERYGAGVVLVAYAALNRGGAAGAGARLEVYITRYGTVEPGHTETLTFDEEPDEGADALLARAARAIARGVEDDWKRNNVVQAGAPSVLAVTIPITSLADWITVRGTLARVPILRKVDLVLLARDRARVNLHYQGQLDQLTVALEQIDLTLSPEGDRWVLTPRARAGGDES
ncbi:MAG: DUF2066 domain-containing protein [Hyphomicrobiales bacterium]|nr:DUF2066 domain-containing protein [Hyphomicrobiales bacterium]MCP5374397.1 DUF2066 domain-containing protein [Hyphomicrobiales bacterium]